MGVFIRVFAVWVIAFNLTGQPIHIISYNFWAGVACAICFSLADWIAQPKRTPNVCIIKEHKA